MRTAIVMTIVTVLAGGAGTVASSSRPPKTHTVTIAEMRFQPASLTAAPGDLVVWVNKDIVAHTATAAGTFDSGTIEPARSWSHRIRKKGEVAYVCTLHPTMKGMLQVK